MIRRRRGYFYNAKPCATDKTRLLREKETIFHVLCIIYQLQYSRSYSFFSFTSYVQSTFFSRYISYWYKLIITIDLMHAVMYNLRFPPSYLIFPPLIRGAAYPGGARPYDVPTPTVHQDGARKTVFIRTSPVLQYSSRSHLPSSTLVTVLNHTSRLETAITSPFLDQEAVD